MFIVTLEISDGFDDKAARMNKAADLAYRDGVRFWRDNYLSGHFRGGAAEKYGYAKRTTNYIKRKIRENKPLAPLIYSGKSRNWLTNVLFFRVTGNRELAVGKFTTPASMRYFWMTPKNHPNKPAEMKRLIPAEEVAVGKYIQERFAYWIDILRQEQKKSVS
jgi:hypothetical protein